MTMRNLFLSIAIIATINVFGQSNEQSASTNPMENIEQRIEKTFGLAFQEKSPEGLLSLQKELTNIYEKKSQNIIQYWRAYLQYRIAIYFIVQNDKERSEKEIDKAVDMMSKMKNKTSEDYALLSICQGFAIQFKNMFTMMSLSGKIYENAQTAISKDAENLRGYYSYGSNDFYRPEKFGGGKEVEKYLQKAISLPAQKVKNPYMPTWGKQESYELLIKWYIRKNNSEKAKFYLKEASEKFPNNWQIKQLETKITGKIAN